jgi:hypothetical protein
MKFILASILKEIRFKYKNLKFLAIKVEGSDYFSKFLFKKFRQLFYKTSFFFISSFKIFNGCRFKKLRRKKHLKYRPVRV